MSDDNKKSVEESEVGNNVFIFTQGDPNGINDNFDQEIFQSSTYEKIKAMCLKEPFKVFRLIIDQGYLPDDVFEVCVRYYKANMLNRDIPGNLIIDFSGKRNLIDDGYTPRPFVDQDKEWFKKFKASCEENPNVIHTIPIEEGDMERGAYLDYVFTLSQNLPDNARVIRVFNKEHDQLPPELNDRFKPIDFNNQNMESGEHHVR